MTRAVVSLSPGVANGLAPGLEGATAWYFGTFNPIHQAHRFLALAAWQQFALGQVVLVPTGTPPNRLQDTTLAPVRHRLAMAQLAVAQDPELAVSAAETTDAGPHYTVATLQREVGHSPRQPVPLLMGADAYGSLPTWRQADWLADHAVFLVAQRDDRPLAPLAPFRMWPVFMPPWALSASWVRQACGKALPLQPWVQPAVANYIAQHRLYS